MANTYRTPGVYIEEVSTLPASVAGVRTAVPAFIGYTEKAGPEEDLTKYHFRPRRITGMPQYVEIFGGPNPEEFDITVKDIYNSDDVLVQRSVKVSLADPSQYKLYYALQMYFNNGGGPCYIVSVGGYTDLVEAPADRNKGLTKGIVALEEEDEPTLLVFPDAISLGNVNDYGGLVQASLMHCNSLQDRFTVADFHGDITSVDEVAAYRTAIGNNFLKYGACYTPKLITRLNYGISEEGLTISTHTRNYENGDDAAANVASLAGTTLGDLETVNPSLYRMILAEIRKVNVEIPPSGAVVGVYARVDRERGVWKAPANESIFNVVGPVKKITAESQADLNEDPTTGKSINAIRSFTGKGTIVWGARTLAGNDNEWKYVPVRRLYIYVEESLKKATEFVVFEPNDATTWLRVRTMSENFLTTLWRDGALAGAAPDDAFFVNVGLGETMTSLDILEGRLNVEIGLAAVRPAEFIILKFSHKLQES